MVKNHPIYYPLYKNNDKDIILITGGRGCETPTQEVVMADMTIKQIKDIKVGDKVMGIDGTPRNVLDVHFGRGQMYKVSQSNADDYFVNDEHVLSLHKSRSAQTDKGRILKNGNRQFKNGRYPSYGNDIDMPIREYMAKSERFRYNFRGFKVKIPYKEQTVSIEPYLLGLWLGDGTCTAPYITNPDEEIRDYIKNYCSRKGQRFFSSLKSGAWQLGIRSFSEKKGANEFLNFLYDKNLIGNKYIPQEYIANSEQIRLQLLAGLVDTDGSYDGWGYEITQKNESLAKQIKFLADSLGFRTHIQTKRAYIGEKDCGLYWRISISGDLYRVPCRVKRKQAQRGDNYNDRTFTESSLKISDIGIGDWVGIELDGDKRYIHSDGTVTHNSGKSFAAGTFVERLSFELGENEGRKIAHQVLYTRYTMTSAQISVIPEWSKTAQASTSIRPRATW